MEIVGVNVASGFSIGPNSTRVAEYGSVYLSVSPNVGVGFPINGHWHQVRTTVYKTTDPYSSRWLFAADIYQSFMSIDARLAASLASYALIYPEGRGVLTAHSEWASQLPMNPFEVER